MFKKFLNCLETSKHPLLGPNLWILELFGLLQPEIGLRKHIYNLVHFGAFLFVVSQYMELYVIRSDLNSALRNLSISMLSTVCVIKAGTYVFWNEKWKKILKWISKTELKLKDRNDGATDMVMKEYKRYARVITYFYWTLVSSTVMTVILAPLATYISDSEYRMRIRNHEDPYPEIMSSWLPFDKSRSVGYLLYILEHTVICFYGGSIVASFDTNAVVVMTFFTGQLKLLSLDCARIFDKNITAAGYRQALINIRDCHERHTKLINYWQFYENYGIGASFNTFLGQNINTPVAIIASVDVFVNKNIKNYEIVDNCRIYLSFRTRYAKLFDALLSPVMFIYMIVCSIMICSSAIQLTKKGTTKMQQIWISEYLVALIAQLFLFCWHSNQVFFMSKEVNRGVYESEWWNQGVRLRRSILLLSGKFEQTIIFTAGPFTNLTIATFVAILKGSYSYYTILSKNAD